MASIFRNIYRPSPRFGHYAVPVGGKCLLWGGHFPDRKKLEFTVEIFDPYKEMWEPRTTAGDLPPGWCQGTCASLLDQLYLFGGSDSASFYNSLHMLAPTSLKWKPVSVLNQDQDQGPMRKQGCGMVAYGRERLALFGGYGIPLSPTQHGVFTKDTRYADGRGWSSELHFFSISEGKWSTPSTTGSGPPPCSDFSFTAVSDHLAVLFGGRQPSGRVNDCYLMDFETLEWTKLDKPNGAPWPKQRAAHAACCLNYGQDHPQVLVTGGHDNNGNTFKDMWILDVKSGRWKEITLRNCEHAQRAYHTVTAFSLGPGRIQVTMFGGCPKWEGGKSVGVQQKLAKTILLDFELVETPSESVDTPSSAGGPPTQEWVLVDVTGSRERGKFRRMRDKAKILYEAHLQQGDGRGQDAKARVQDQLEESFQMSELEYAEARAQSLQIQLEEFQESFQMLESKNRDLQTQLETSQAEKRALQEKLKASQDAYRESQQSLQATQVEKQNLLKSLDEANAQIEDLQRRVKDAEHRAKEAE